MIRHLLNMLLVLMLCGCSASSLFNSSGTVNTGVLSPNSLIYSVPLTSFKIDFEIVRHHHVSGPYSNFANRFLGIDNVLQKDSVWHTMNQIDVTDFLEADPDAYYQITFNKKISDYSELFRFTREGLIVLPGQLDSMREYSLLTSENKQIHFTDYSVKRNEVIEPETFYKIDFKDSIFVKVPVQKDMLHVKSTVEKAEEAANFIIKTRKRRFKLLAGQYDHFPKGDALAISVEELNRTEEKYLSLFIGKHYADTLRYSFYITPQKNQANNFTVAYFSEQHGITKSDLLGDPVSVSIMPSGKTSKLEGIKYNPEEDQINDRIFYRIPDKASIELFFRNQSVIREITFVHQFGQILSIPVVTGK